MRYLIIGGTSVFSEPVIDLLLDKEETEQIVATKLSHETEFYRDKLTWLELDVRNAARTDDVVKKANADVIFDFKTQDSVGHAWKNPKETVDINIIGTINILNAVKELDNKPRVIIGGSGEEYGWMGYNQQPLIEESRTNPVNIFGATKSSQTMFAKLYVQAYGLDVVIVRTFNETSNKQDDKYAISSICHQFACIERGEQEPIIHIGALNNIRDFTDVNDLAS